MDRFFKGLLFLLLFNILNSATAQSTISYLTTSDGLSQGMVTSIIQDKEGFIWAGTLDGLNRYDGYQFKIFTHDPFDSNSISGNTIEFVFEDSKGGIWVSIENLGLDYYDKKSGRFIHLFKTYPILKNSEMKQMVEMPDGSLWLNYFSIGVVKIARSAASPQVQSSDFTVQPIPLLAKQPLVDARNSKIFVQDASHLGYYEDGSLYLYNTINNSIEKDELSSHLKGVYYLKFCHDKFDDTYWIINKNELQHWKNSKMVAQINLPIENTTPNVGYQQVNIDYKHNIWCLGEKGCVKIDDQQFGKNNAIAQKIFNEGNPISLMVDKQYRVWIGTNGFGLISFNGSETVMQTLPIVEGNHYIDGNEQRTFIRRLNSLFELINDAAITPTLVPVKPVNALKVVSNLLEAKDGTRIYVGQIDPKADEKLDLYKLSADGKTLLAYSIPNGIRVNDFHIKMDEAGNCWFELPNKKLGCIWHGTNLVKEYDFSAWMPKNDKSVLIKNIYQSKNGVIWLSTAYGLLKMRLDKATANFNLYSNNPLNKTTLSNNYIMGVYDDPFEPNDYLWVATKGGGLNKFNKATATCEHFTTKDGLPNNVVYAVLPDKRGRLWVSTNQGIACFIPSKRFFHNFTLADGLQANEFNSNSFFKHPDGRLFFGGVSGINIINPSHFNFDTTFAPVYFTNLKINNQSIEPFDSTHILNSTLETTQTIQLHYFQNFINIRFAATSFYKLGVNHYRVKMDGVDEDWVYTDTRNEVSYPNLKPGTYTLRVINSNENGDWNSKEAVISFVISPPWWQSYFAYVVYLLALIALGISLYRFQIRRIRLQNDLINREEEAKQLAELDEFKNRFFTNVTHELRTPLTLIAEPARMLLSDKRIEGSPIVQTIYNNSLKLLRLVNTLLDISKLEAGKMNLHFAEGDIVLHIKTVYDSFQVAAEQKQLQVQFLATPNVIIASIDKPMMEKITYNLLSNAIKFTPEGGKVTLSISADGADSWILEVIDTGIGIPEKNIASIFSRFYQVDNSSTRRGEGTGIGLALVKELVDQVKGTIEVKSKLGEGTKFSIRFATYPNNAMNNPSTAAPLDSKNSFPAKRTTSSPKVEVVQSIWATPEIINPATVDSSISDVEQGDAPDERSVLIVEDNAEMRFFIGTILKEHGYNTIYEAADGQAGIDKAKELMPSIIITDLMMPNKDGFELVQELKNNILTSHIPIVMLTAKQSLDSKLQGYRKGADAYLSKPFHSDELVIRMQQLLDAAKRLQAKFNTHNAEEAPTTNKTEDAIVTSTNQATTTTVIEPTSEEISTLDIELIERIQHFIFQRLDAEKIDLDELAQMLNMSRRNFSRKLNALTGLSPVQYIRNIRLDHAYHLLITQSDIKINEVMFQVGITDKKHFHTHFKERFGDTPLGIAQKGGAFKAEID